MDKQLCICDIETVYLKRLASYLKRKPAFSWKIKTYADLELCIRERPEVLIVSGSALERWQNKNNSMQCPEIVGCRMIFLDDEKIHFEHWPTVEKYQSAEKVYEDLLEILEEEMLFRTEVIGIYGPSDGPEAERLAQEIGRGCLEQGEVLIVSLVEYSTILKDLSEGNGIDEWFYYHSQNVKEKTRLSEWTFTEEGLNYLQGFRTIYDQRGISLNDWQDFFKEGLKKSRYHTVLLVFDRMPEYLELFMWCDSIYVQWGRDGYGNLRKHKFEKMTKYMEMNRLIKKFKEQ